MTKLEEQLGKTRDKLCSLVAEIKLLEAKEKEILKALEVEKEEDTEFTIHYGIAAGNSMKLKLKKEHIMSPFEEVSKYAKNKLIRMGKNNVDIINISYNLPSKRMDHNVLRCYDTHSITKTTRF